MLPEQQKPAFGHLTVDAPEACPWFYLLNNTIILLYNSGNQKQLSWKSKFCERCDFSTFRTFTAYSVTGQIRNAV